MYTGKNRPCIDNIAYIAGADGIQNLRGAFRKLPAHAGADTVLTHIICCSYGGFNVKAHVIEAFYKGEGLLLIFVCKGYHYGSVVLHLYAGGSEGLKYSPMKLVIIAYSLTRGLHFRRQIGIHAGKL